MPSFIPEKYPPEYLAGFRLSDAEAVSRVIQFLSQSDLKVDAVVVQITDRGTVLHVARGNSLNQVNWSRPEQVPGDLDGYARVLYEFAGPDEMQLARAQMLAEALGCPLLPDFDILNDYFWIVNMMSIGQMVMRPRSRQPVRLQPGVVSDVKELLLSGSPSLALPPSTV